MVDPSSDSRMSVRGHGSVVFDRHPVTVAGAPGGTTAAYRIGHDRALVIDPATDLALPSTVTVAHVAVTHHHPDHVGGMVAHAGPQTTVWCRPGRDREAAFRSATGVTPARRLQEGTVIPTDAGPVTVRDTPGHAPEHVAFELPATGSTGSRGWVVGDLAVADGSVAVAAPEGDLRAYLSSLRRVYAQDPRRLYPAHGPVIDAPRAVAARLIAHRLERDRRVLVAVRGGARTVPAVTDAAYDKDVSAVRDLAEGTVRAHLERLATLGRVRFDGRRAEPRD